MDSNQPWRFFSDPIPQPTKPTPVKQSPPEKRGWRIKEWYPQVGISRAWTCQLIKDGKIKTVKLGRARIIITPPSEFLAKLEPPA